MMLSIDPTATIARERRADLLKQAERNRLLRTAPKRGRLTQSRSFIASIGRRMLQAMDSTQRAATPQPCCPAAA